jgi:hypothetical protein
LVQQADDQWSSRPGTFTWRVVWFNDYVFEGPEDWEASDILSIPEPTQLNATRLHAAIAHGLDVAEDIRSPPRAEGDANSDSNILIVLSDGQDNSSERAISTPDLDFAVDAPVVDSRAEAVKQIEGVDWLTLHMLVFGDDVDAEPLGAFSDAGGGRLVSRPTNARSGIDELFDEALKEFVTRETVGFYAPVRVGEWEWSIEFDVASITDDKRAQPLLLSTEVRVDPDNTPPCGEALLAQLGGGDSVVICRED